MKSTMQKAFLFLLAALFLTVLSLPVLAEESDDVSVNAKETENTDVQNSDSGKTGKAVSAAIAVGLAAAAGAFSMGMAISKSAESIARQPEAAGNIRTSLMLGLVFIETAIIYALIVGILIIFVL